VLGFPAGKKLPGLGLCPNARSSKARARVMVCAAIDGKATPHIANVGTPPSPRPKGRAELGVYNALSFGECRMRRSLGLAARNHTIGITPRWDVASPTRGSGIHLRLGERNRDVRPRTGVAAHLKKDRRESASQTRETSTACVRAASEPVGREAARELERQPRARARNVLARMRAPQPVGDARDVERRPRHVVREPMRGTRRR
jgi:hypothetical protein